MTTRQQNRINMYQALVRFFSNEGVPLLGIKRIDFLVKQLKVQLAAHETAAGQQNHTPTGATRSRKQVLKEAKDLAEVLRVQARNVLTDTNARADLAKPVAGYGRRDEATLLRYLNLIADVVPTLDVVKLGDVGYVAQNLTDLEADLEWLATTTGAAQDIIDRVAMATDDLTEHDAALAATRDELTELVRAQRRQQQELVELFNQARKITKSAVSRRRVLQGAAPHGQPALVLDRRQELVTSLTLANRGGSGTELRYYFGATPTALPAAGQGVALSGRKPRHLPSLEVLGDPAHPYLLALQTTLAPDGEYWVQL
jgi:hypothetical protein